MKALRVMTSPVVTVRPSTALDDAAQLLVHHSVNTLPVTDDDERLLGVVTETDVFRALALRIGIGLSHTGRLRAEEAPKRVADIARAAAAWVKPDDDVSFCLLLMVLNDGKSLPVLDRGRVVGIISRREALDSLSRAGSIDLETLHNRVSQGQLPAHEAMVSA